MFQEDLRKDDVQEPDFVQYEAKKASWLKTYPDATQADYEAAMRIIAYECGL
jgi:hypothetical protein